MTKKHRSLLLCLLALVLTVSCLSVPAAASINAIDYYQTDMLDLSGSSSKSYYERKVAYLYMSNNYGILHDKNSGGDLVTNTWASSDTSIATVAYKSQSDSETTAKVSFLKPGWVEITHTYKKSGLLQTEKKTTFLVIINSSLNSPGGYLYFPNDVTYSGDPITASTSSSFYSKSFGKIPAGKTVYAPYTVKNYAGNTWYLLEYNGQAGFVYGGSVKVLCSEVTISATSVTLDLNGTKTTQLTAKVYPAAAADTSITWSSSNTSVATVSSSGLVTAKGVGTATITAKNVDAAGKSHSCTCAVTVKDTTPHVTGVTVKPTTLTLLAGKYSTLTPTVSPSNAVNKSVTWSSSNTSVATVTSAGKVTGVAPGTATITVKTADGGKTATCKVTVWKPTKDTALSEYLKYCPVTATTGSVTWNKSSTNASLYKIYRLPTTCDNTVSYTVSNVDKLSVSGKVTNHAGNLWYEVPGGYVYSGDVTFSSSLIASSVSLSSTSYSCHEGSTFTLTATVSPSGAANKNVTWSSSNPDIASVSSSGQVTTHTWGTTTITATAADGSGKKASCSVTVSQHSYTYSVTTEPGETTTGVLTGKCSCGAGTTVTLPALNSSEYSYETITYATTTSTGLGRYTWNDTRYGTYSFDVVIPIPETGAITGQPQDQVVALNASAAFTVETTGPIFDYQWQWRASASDGWKDCTSDTVGYNEMTLKPVATAASNGRQYRCVVTDLFLNTLYTEPATLTVKAGLAITTQPQNVTVALGETGKFTVAATGDNLTYQWQYKSATATSWKNSGNATAKTATLEMKADSTRNGMQFRCVVKDSAGNTVTSSAATMTVYKKLAITAQPKNVTLALGETGKFTVTATGEGLIYQWQYKSATATSWKNSGNATAKTATLEMKADSTRNGMQFRCVVKDSAGNTVTSSAATMTIAAATGPVITGQPQNATVTMGQSGTFTVTAAGTGLSYQWQYKSATATSWKNSGNSTATTATLKMTADATRNGMQFRCVITDATGNSVTSAAATMTITEKLAITGQPQNVTVALGESGRFTVTATGAGLSYQWQYKSATATSWKNSGNSTATTATLKMTADATRNGMQFRCIVTDANGNTVTSNPATMTIQ